jgi:hypothetical protein
MIDGNIGQSEQHKVDDHSFIRSCRRVVHKQFGPRIPACTFFAMLASECFFYFAVEVPGRTKVMRNRDRDIQFEKLTVYVLFPEFFLRIRVKEVNPLEANSVGPRLNMSTRSRKPWFLRC